MEDTVWMKKMTLAIDVNSNMVRAINGRLSDMDISAVRGITNKRTDGWTNDNDDDDDGGSTSYTREQELRV